TPLVTPPGAEQPSWFGWAGLAESEESASDGELADALAIDDAADFADDAAVGLPLSSSPTSAKRGRHSRKDKSSLDLSAFARPDDLADADADAKADDSRSAKKRRGRRRARRKAPWWELPGLVLFAILIAVLVKTFVIQPFYIPSQSMEHTLYGCPGCSGDRILVNKMIYDLRDPHPGDIVVFNAPPGWNDEPTSQPPSNPIVRAVRGFGQLIGFVPPDGLVLVKRVIASGGQTVKGVAGPDGHDIVMVSDNGNAGPWSTLDEPFTFYDGTDSHAAFGPVTVPKGRLWVMGDHRNDSADSRFHCNTTNGMCGADADPVTSTVPISDVIGKAFVIAWPPSRWRTLGTPSTFEHAAMAAGGGLPAVASTLFVVPAFFVRRRRRRSRRGPGR
ncbi:MAG: signal peptidase I, partial [Jatrophihabitantaceae bacterium]